MNHLNEIRNKVTELIKGNDLVPLENYVSENDLELKTLNTPDFNILQWTHSLFEKGSISKDVKKFVMKHFDNKRNEVIDLIKQNNLENLKSYVETKDIEFKIFDRTNFNDFDIVKFVLGLYKLKKISYEVKEYVKIHYDRTRSEIVKLIQSDSINELAVTLENKGIELKSINDDLFDIVIFCKGGRKNGVSRKMTNYVISHLDRHRSFIVESIRSGKKLDILDYLRKHNLELKDLNDKHFNTIDYCDTLIRNQRISLDMKTFIIYNYTTHRREIIALIKRGDTNELKSFMENNHLKLKMVNDENFNIIEFCQSDCHIDDKMTVFVISQYNTQDQFDNNGNDNIKDNSNNNIKDNSNIDIKDNSNNNIKDNPDNNIMDNFNNNINYNPNNDNINIKDNQNNTELLDLIKRNNLEELQSYANSENIKFEKYCHSTFNIVDQAYSLYQEKAISSEILNFILTHFNKHTESLFELMKNGDLLSLKNYLYDPKDIIKIYNKPYIKIVRYSQSYLKDTVPLEIFNFLLNYFDPKINHLIHLMQNENFKKLYYFIEKYEIKDLNNDFFHVIEFCLDESNRISSKIKYFIINHYNRTRSDIVELIHKNNIVDLLQYIQIHLIQLEDLNDEYFDLMEYCNSNRRVQDKTKRFIISHMNNVRSTIVEYVRRNKFYELEIYAKENHIEFKVVNDDSFDLLEYCEKEVLNCSDRIKNFIIRNFDKTRVDILNLIESGDITNLMSYLNDHPLLELKDLDDSHFKLLEFCSNPKNCNLKMKMFVINHYTRYRGEIVERIRKNNFEDLKSYVQNNKIDLETMNDAYFDLKRYTYSLYNNRKISTEIKDFIIINSNKIRSIIIHDFIERNSINGLKIYTEENHLEFKQLNDEYFNIIHYINSLCENDKSYEVIRNYIFTHFDSKIGQIIEMIQMDDLDDFKKFVNDNISYESIDQNYLTIIKELCFKKVKNNFFKYSHTYNYIIFYYYLFL